MNNKSRYRSTIEETKRLMGYVERQGEIQMVDTEFCSNLDAPILTSVKFKIQKGEVFIKRWMTENGFVVCKKSEATASLIFGKKNSETFSWIAGQFKNIWIKSK